MSDSKFPGKSVSKTKDNDRSVEQRKKDASENDAMGAVTGGECIDAQGNIDSVQSAKPVPCDALKMDIPASATAGAVGNQAQPGHDNAKLAQDEESEDVDGEVADEDEGDDCGDDCDNDEHCDDDDDDDDE